jgi:hypothetical protein
MEKTSMLNEIVSIVEPNPPNKAVVKGLTASEKPYFKIICDGNKVFNILEDNLVKSGYDKTALVVGATFSVYFNELPLKTGGVTRWINKISSVSDVLDKEAEKIPEQSKPTLPKSPSKPTDLTELDPVLAYIAIEIVSNVMNSHREGEEIRPIDVDSMIQEFDNVYGQLEHKYKG